MSWFETVVNTVSALSKTIDSAFSFIINPTSAANPFKDKIQGKPNLTCCECNENENRNRNEGHESGREGSSRSRDNVSRNRIASRARYSYELDRFRKNAMLIFLQIVSEPRNGCRLENSSKRLVQKLQNTFNAFRFEVDIHEDLTCAEIDAKCNEFFQRDFREYGAVVVMVLSFDAINGQIAARDTLFDESIILRHLTDDVKPSLVNKPKIYITETNRSGPLLLNGHKFQYSLPIREDHHDILVLHVPFINHGSRIRGALSIICDNMNEMAESKDFVSILQKSIEDASREDLMLRDLLPITFSHNFTKEMMLFSQVPQ